MSIGHLKATEIFLLPLCAWLQSESLAHIFKAIEHKSKPETKSEADKALISQIESVQKDILEVGMTSQRIWLLR